MSRKKKADRDEGSPETDPSQHPDAVPVTEEPVVESLREPAPRSPAKRRAYLANISGRTLHVVLEGRTVRLGPREGVEAGAAEVAAVARQLGDRAVIEHPV